MKHFDRNHNNVIKWFGHKVYISSNKKVVMRYFIKRNGDRYKCRVLGEQIVSAGAGEGTDYGRRV